MLNSDYRPLCPVRLPYAGRQFYMHEFDIARPVMPAGFEDYAEPVTALLAAANVTRGSAFLTVDEKIVLAGNAQRKPGPHVDGCFRKAAMDWKHDDDGGGFWTHAKQSIGRWGHGQWNHSCNIVPFERMPVIVAASVAGCKAWRGNFDAMPKEDGDLSHLPLGEGELIPANIGYLLSPDCVHESLPFAQDTRRSFMRIALPVGSYA